jgi:hypothetical protein
MVMRIGCAGGVGFARGVPPPVPPRRRWASATFERTLVFAMALTRTSRLGPAARPVAVPEDLDDSSLPKASGEVELPLHIRWSGPSLIYDLNDRADRARV